MTKEQVITSLRDLPDDFELEDLFERLVFIKRVEEGLRQADNGETVSEADARAYLSRWTAGVTPPRQG
jgi:predicted transcriptional regulator